MKKYLPYAPGIVVIVFVAAFTFCQGKMNPEWLETEYREFEKIVLKPDNFALREYYDGIHLCRVGYEKITQSEIEKIKFLLQLK